MPELFLGDIEEQTILRCAGCDGDYLHHVKVDVFERREDADEGIHASVTGSGMTVDSDLTDNPSGRRHGLTIRFACESCSMESVLTIAQHKGQTFLEVIRVAGTGPGPDFGEVGTAREAV